MSNLGIHLGQVVRNDDPNQRGRIRAMSSTLLGSGIVSSSWIDAVLPVGFYSIPNVGDKVILIAENNDPTFLHYLGLSLANSIRDGANKIVPPSFNASLPGQQITLSSIEGNSIVIDDSINKITLTAPNVIVNGDLTINGELTVTGSIISQNGNITALTGDILASTISLKTHLHSGVQTGGGVSGPPVP